MAHINKIILPNQIDLPLLSDGYTGTYALLMENSSTSETRISMYYPESDICQLPLN